jgi:hypothetical protein
MKLREIAYSRSGDKGNTSNICFFPYHDKDYPLLLERLTVETIRQKLGGLVAGKITRYEMPGSMGLNFVLEEALAGGVSLSLRTDPHGKALQSLVLDIDV